jgi:hypothetical protein
VGINAVEKDMLLILDIIRVTKVTGDSVIHFPTVIKEKEPLLATVLATKNSSTAKGEKRNINRDQAKA